MDVEGPGAPLLVDEYGGMGCEYQEVHLIRCCSSKFDNMERVSGGTYRTRSVVVITGR